VYIDKGLVESKIAILRGKGSENNRLLLERLALEGPLIKYDLFKRFKKQGTGAYYPTVSRRVDDLVARGYLRVVGKRIIVVGRRRSWSSTYGVTWKGLISSLTSDLVVGKVIQVFERNPQLELPFPREPVLAIVRELFTDRELGLIGRAFLTGYLRAIPKDLESLTQEKLLAYLLPAIAEAPEIKEKFEKKDLSGLMKIPEVRDFVSRSVDDFEEMLEASLLGIRELKARYLQPKETLVSDLGKGPKRSKTIERS